MLHAAKMDLRYWGEAFMYAIYIRRLTHTSALNGIVPQEAWSGQKPDISHLRVFGSVCFANIPKKLRGGKLEETSIKCRLMGWWVDEAKGYRLEEVATGKLIASRDVRFVEDDSPSDLAVIDTRGTAPTMDELENLVPEASAKVDKHLTAHTPATKVPQLPASVQTSPPSANDPPEPPASTNDNEESNSAPIPKRHARAAKWDALPPREHPTRNRAPPAPPGIEATEDEIDIAA